MQTANVIEQFPFERHRMCALMMIFAKIRKTQTTKKVYSLRKFVANQVSEHQAHWHAEM